MGDFFRRFMAKQVAQSETRLLHRQIDESEVCVVSVESLRCSICYSIYSGTPLMLQCGHSYCTVCIRQLGDQIQNSETQTVPCPICRKTVNLESAVKNYGLKSILDTVNEISKEEERAGRAYSNTMEVTNEVLRQQLAEVEESKSQLELELLKSRRDAIRNYIIMVFIGILMFAYLKNF